MSFEIRPTGITEIKCDCIVNSLGMFDNVTSYGAVCKSIVNEATSSKIKTDIASWKEQASPCNIFLTGSYGISKTKHILHVVTPYYKDDKDLYDLEYLYKRILMTAVNNKWKSIALPLLGTGANKYPYILVLKLVEALIREFTKHYNVNIILSYPVKEVSRYTEAINEKAVTNKVLEFYKEYDSTYSRNFEYSKDDFENFEHFRVGTVTKRDVIRERERYLFSNERAGTLRFLDEMEVLLNSGEHPVKPNLKYGCDDNVTAYIERYIEARYKTPENCKRVSKYVYTYVSEFNETSTKAKHSDPKRRATISNRFLMRYILALRMTIDEAKAFYEFCGKAFSPMSKEDKRYIEIIEAHEYKQSEIDAACMAMGVHTIFIDEDEYKK